MKRIRQLVRRIWYFVDTAFNNASIDVRTGEKESRASSSRRNQGRINKERKKHGHKTEFLFKFNQGELGCAEVGKEDTGDEDLKLRAITLDRPLTYICYDRYILKHIIQSTASTGFQTQSANQRLREIFGGGPLSSTKVMLHLVNHPSMKNHVHNLQAKFILRSLNLPDDTLLSWLLPYLRTSASHSHWYKLTSSPLWRVCCNQDIEYLNRQMFRTICRKYLVGLFNQNCQRAHSKLLSACRSQSTIDPILWLSMISIERSRVVRWRLG
ncbi:hypothetical protein G6F44_003950 [Rhizopus delemar]|nr:hypothetical protein G6F44_003950 [Rhizopus delemar]